MLQFLRKPYPIDKSFRRMLVVALLFGLFVFAFLRYFEPFGIHGLKEKTLVCGFFGAWCFVAVLLLNNGVLLLFGKWFREDRWTAGKEILWALIHIAVIGLGNAVFMVMMGYANWSVEHFLTYVGYTLIVGVFPVTVSVLLTEIRLSRQYLQQSAELNTMLHPETTGSDAIVLPSENKNEDLNLLPDDLIYLEAAENYVTVFYKDRETIRKSVLRSTLKAQEELLQHLPAIFRPHKSFLVNCNHISHISGNAQGYKLHLNGISEPIPVSRRQNEALRQRIAAN